MAEAFHFPTLTLILPFHCPARPAKVTNYTLRAAGVFLCISPWNFSLAIFTGQSMALLVAGNTVIAKPAEQTSLVAYHAVELMHRYFHWESKRFEERSSSTRCATETER